MELDKQQKQERLGSIHHDHMTHGAQFVHNPFSYIPDSWLVSGTKKDYAIPTEALQAAYHYTISEIPLAACTTRIPATACMAVIFCQ